MLKKIILILFILTISSNAFSEELSRNRARQIRITDTGDYFVSTQVEGALQELGATGGESTTVSDTTTINLTLTGADITADGLYTAGDYITLTGADFDVDNMLNTITTPDAEVTAGLGITFADTGIMTITEAADTITFDATEVDGSTSNEINTVQGDDNTATTGLAISIDGAGIVTTDVIGDVLTITGTEAQGLSAITTIDATTTDDVTVGDFVMSDGNPWAGWADTDTNTGYIIHWESGDTYPFGLWGVTFTASAPSVSPNTPIWWVNSSNDFNVSGNGASVPSFTVARATGNVSVTNDLTVSGTTTLTGTLTVDSNTVNLSDTTDEYVLAFDTGTQTWRGVVAATGTGDLLADGSVPLTADWDAGNSLYDITAVEFKGALIGNADTVTTNANLTGEVTSVGNAATIADSVAVTSWNLTTPTITTSLTTSTPTTISAAELDRLDGLAGVITTDTTACTEIDGTNLTITTGTLNVDNPVVANLTGNASGSAGTVATITGLAPDTQNTYARTQYLIPYASTTTAWGQIAIGTATHVLTSNGAGAAPTFQAAAGGAAETLATTLAAGADANDVNITSGADIALDSLTPDAASITINENANNDILILDNDGTGGGFKIQQDGILATNKYPFWVYTNAAQTNANCFLTFFEQDNAGSDEEVLIIQNDGTGNAFELQQNGNGVSLYVVNNGTKSCLKLFQNGIAGAAENGLWVYSNADQDTSPLAFFEMDLADSSTAVIAIQQDGTGVQIDGDGDENLSNVGVWTDRSSTFSDKDDIKELTKSVYTDKLKNMKLYKYKKKSEKYGNKEEVLSDTETIIVPDDLDQDGKVKTKNPRKFVGDIEYRYNKNTKKYHKMLGMEYPKKVKQNNPKEYIGLILDEPTTPEELISRDLEGNMNGKSGTQIAEFCLVVIKELISRIELLEAEVKALK